MPITESRRLRCYYDQRAAEYESIYQRGDPIRQAEQSGIAETCRTAFRCRRVLEVACGTGYWTAAYADVASCVLAFDTSLSALEIARAKDMPAGRVRFLEADAWRLEEVEGCFNAGLAAFWASHLPRRNLSAWLDAFHARLEPGASVVLVDNVFFPGIGGDLVVREGCDDTFKRRRLADGTEHEVVKNYLSEPELRRLLTPRSEHLHLHVGACFWWARYTTA